MLCGFHRPAGVLDQDWKQWERKYTHQQKGEDNTSHEEPLACVEGNSDTAIDVLVRTIVEDFVGPGRGRQHGDGGEDIGDIDEEGFEDNDVKPHVPAPRQG